MASALVVADGRRWPLVAAGDRRWRWIVVDELAGTLNSEAENLSCLGPSRSWSSAATSQVPVVGKHDR
ncbi:hypothetical protein E4U42_001918 [Claviceps africana]|uniref:Uncharacterized protein n=1 Tax=Claviceps africana TaxID=83212 RepID=A0A8K0J9G3_9HYPO|nr:hypothetical protein E4U42_001918 [Claviceps africana]